MFSSFLTICLLFALSALFSSSECSIFSLKESDIEALKEQKSFLVKCLLSLWANKTNCLIVILIGNLIVNIFLSAMVSDISLNMFGEMGLSYSVFIVTILLLIFGEVTPKTIALKNAPAFALMAAPVLVFVRRIVSPVIAMLEWVSEFTLNLAFGEEKEETFSADELETVVSIGTQDGVFNPWEKKLIEQIFDFNEVYAVERMTPRPDILALDVESTREEVEKVIQGVKYSKIPVYEEEFDHIVGYIQVKMFLLFPEKSIRELLVPVHIVPEMKRVDKLLEEMQAKKTKMAVLLDEYANVQGIVTIRDILEILFGDLSSFPKKVKANIYKLREQVYRVPGRTSLREINEFIDYDLFDEDAENSDTIAGYLLSMAELNRLPAVGDSYETDDYRISVRKVMKRRIMEVELQVVKSMELEAK